ncbi:exodeoxyribonuclease VII large subunit [Kushneria phosphatilytica]|uniref:Exodeoxyribonuclease 7 large subunit n=1 Tax=Kushneria phosphatilytica TaxID=657387 RepID=A0A1S1P027_9GAMM|nr:exodeoxyribonuclease VII large subunit [Kushneria phosphatilytica]OHV13890.1 exodeoxyribonuclease VII large subunit [Kushneria phosphatilytica]QEL10449.1 exodeoxyribonuclease VII large subunit [Kushneria phosphatilytica]
MAEAATTALSVSELNRQARQALERNFGEIWVEGELSRVSRPSSGHLYFTLKDDRAQVSCALFRNRARFVAAPMREGDHVRVRAKVSVFEPRGDYQLIVEAVQEAGRGALLAALERLKQKLHGEGVFANARPLPFPPRQLGIITSASGAAIRDVLAVLKARWPLLEVSLLPVPVQGDQAAPAMIRALAAAARDGRFDALLMTRGGGSLEDLWCFNDEALMRAIHASPIPVMSAVGHEIDSTLADLAADVSAPTPSAAAERLVPDQQDLRHRLNVLNQRIERAGRYQLDQAQQRLDHARARLRHPGERLEAQRQQLSRLEQRAQRAMTQRLVREREHFTHDQQRLRAYSPERALQEARTRLTGLNRRLEGATTRTVSAQRQRLQASARALNAVSPLGVLERGYAILEQDGGSVVRRAHDTQPGETLTARLGEGRLKLEVKRRLKK